MLSSQTLSGPQTIMMICKLDVVRYLCSFSGKEDVIGTSGQGTQEKYQDLTFRVNAKPELKPGGDSGANVTEVFNTTDYINRQIENFGEQSLLMPLS